MAQSELLSCMKRTKMKKMRSGLAISNIRLLHVLPFDNLHRFVQVEMLQAKDFFFVLPADRDFGRRRGRLQAPAVHLKMDVRLTEPSQIRRFIGLWTSF